MKNHILWGKLEDISDEVRRDLEGVTCLSSSASLINSSHANSSQTLAPPPPAQRGAASDQRNEDFGDDAEHQQQQIQHGDTAIDSVQGADLEALRGCIPSDDQGRLTSLGSVLHAGGECTACVFALTDQGCKHGVLCTFCHFPHERRKAKNNKRPSKDKRDRYRKVTYELKAKLDPQGGDDPKPMELEACAIDLPPRLASNEAMRDKVLAQLEAHRKKVRQGGGDPQGEDRFITLLQARMREAWQGGDPGAAGSRAPAGADEEETVAI